MQTGTVIRHHPIDAHLRTKASVNRFLLPVRCASRGTILYACDLPYFVAKHNSLPSSAALLFSDWEAIL